MTKHELCEKDKIIFPLIEQGQSPYHIITPPPELDMSARSLYTYLDQGLFTARNASPDLNRGNVIRHKSRTGLYSKKDYTLISVNCSYLPLLKWIPYIPPESPAKRC